MLGKIFRKTFFAFFLLGCFSLYPQTQQKCFRIGVHADNNAMFLNLFTGAFWIGNTPPLDTNGYPVSIPYGGTITSVEAIMSSFQSTIWSDSVYVVRWDGDGDATITNWYTSGSNIDIKNTKNGENGRIEFSVHYNSAWSAEDQYQVKLRITRSNASNHMRNIRLYLKTFENAYENQGKRIHPWYIEKTQPFGMFRFMGAFNINGCPMKTWAERTPPTYFNQTSGPYGAGLAYEWACRLCNETKKHMYFNVPHQADNDAIRKMAETVYKNLDPDLNVYVEYSNETWNWGFNQFYWILNYANTYCGGSLQKANAQLSMNAFRIWRQVFGRDSLRVRRVMTGHPYGCLQGCGDGLGPKLQYMSLNDFDVIAGAYYWGDINRGWTDVNTAISNITASIRSTADGSWYSNIKRDCQWAKLLGKEFYCYEGGFGADPTQYTNYANWQVIRNLQLDSRLRPLVKEVFDSLASIGADGGNELALVGGWYPIAVNGGNISFWGNLSRLDASVASCPKQAGIVDYVSVNQCDNPIKNSDTVGAGLAFRFDGVNDYVDASTAWKPNEVSDNYTIETWVRPEYLGTNQYIWSLAYGTNPAGNVLYIGTDSRFHWIVKNNSGVTVVSLTGSLAEQNKWYHVAVVKNGTSYKLYINGTEKASATANATGDCSRSRLILGAYISGGQFSDFFRGRMDEFRLWNTAITSLSTLRDWMCRKIKSSHPSFAFLKAYYRFDIVDVTGKVKDCFGSAHAQLQNVVFSQYSNYMASGAPVGDNSVQLYPAGWTSTSLSYVHPNGDRLTVTNLGKGNPEGVHIYLVAQKPSNSTPPSTQYTKLGNYYYGVFTANGTTGTLPEYTVIYSYAGNPDASPVAASNRLVRRDNNADQEGWQNSGAILDAVARTLKTRTGREAYAGEYIIGQRPTLNRNFPGPGYALKFNGSSKAEMLFRRPDDEYTVCFWYKNIDDKYYDLVSFNGPGGAGPNCTRVTGTNNSLGVTAMKGWGSDVNVAWQYNVVESSGGWNHVAVVKKNDIVSVYVNGRLLDAKGMGVTSEGIRRDADFFRLLLGYSDDHNANYFTGWLDELQIWDVALDSNTIRQWMCRKITSRHPLEADHLILYFNFDEGTGSVIENTRGAGDMTLPSGITYQVSGAPIGDTSAFVYFPSSTGNAGKQLSIAHPNGDYLLVKVGTPTDNLWGMHLYRVDGTPQFSTFPAQAQSRDTTRYWGVFVCPSFSWSWVNRYTITANYKYTGNPNINTESELRLLDRTSNASPSWNFNSNTPDVTNDFLPPAASPLSYTTPSGYQKVDKEFMLCGTQSNTITINTSVPAQPSAINGPTTVCAGATGIVYSVTRVPGVQYVWTLPAGMAGYSDSNKIIVTVSPTASGSLGNISVAAVNRYGQGPARTLAVTAQSVPSLSVDINGPTEVCASQSAVYSIPAVPGATAYTWTVTPDGSITANNSTSITVLFGQQSGIISVTGTFGCGSSLLNTKPVSVSLAPSANLSVTGGRVCKGVSEYGEIIVRNSETGVIYQAYKNNGTAPIGQPVTGTGSDITLSLPLSELLAGDNTITVKARAGNCAEVALLQTAVFTVDVSPNPGMTVSYSPTICVGDTAKVVFPDALSGMTVSAKIISYWRVDDASPKYLYPPVPLGNDKTLNLPPSPWNGQLSGIAINKGRNDVTFTVTNGSCPPVELSTKAIITVPNNPHTIDFHDGGLQWWINTGSPWNPMPNFADSIRVSTNKPNSPICQTDQLVYTIYNAQKDVKYYARIRYNTNGAPSYVGPVVSNVVIPTTDKIQVTLTVPPLSMPVTPGGNYNDFDEIEVIAEGFGCAPVLASWRYQVLPGPDTTRQVIGSTVCLGDNGTITIRNSQNGLTYRAYRQSDPVNPVANVNGNGGSVSIPISSTYLPALGTYYFTVTVGSSNCSYIAFSKPVPINVINAAGFTKNNLVKLAFDEDRTCRGLDDSIWVMNSLPGVSYRAYVNGNAVGTAVIGTGANISITLPWSDLATFSNQTVTVSVRATAGSCINNVQLDNTKQLYVNNNVDLTNERVWINRNIDWRGDGTFMICPEQNYSIQFPVQLRNVTTTYPVTFKAAFTNSTLNKDTLLNVTASQTAANQYSTDGLSFNQTLMPRKSLKYIKVFVKEPGCPLHEAKSVSGNNGDWAWTNPNDGTRSHRVVIYPSYVDNPPVIPDTVCTGNVATVRVYTNQPNYGLQESEGPFGSDFRLLNSADVEIASASGYWGSMSRSRYLNLAITAPSYLSAGLNTFRIQESYGGCPWHTLTAQGKVLVNVPPDKALDVTFVNNCSSSDAIATVKQSQNAVLYQPVMGGLGVSQPKYGNGNDLSFNISKTYIQPGSNEVSFMATIKGCPSVTLDKRATIQDVSSLPAKPSTPQGPTAICPGDSNVVYSVSLDPNVLTYVWKLPSGATTASTSNIATVTFSSGGGTVSVVPVNACGEGPESDPLTVTVSSTATGGTLSGPSQGCTGERFSLTLSNYVGTIKRWQYSTSAGIWNDIAVTQPSYTTMPLLDTTTFRVEVKSGNCDSTFSSEFVIYVPEGTVDTSVVIPPVTISGNQAITCLESNELYTSNIPNMPQTWSVSTAKGTITPPDTAKNITVRWLQTGSDTLVLLVNDTARRCLRMGILPVTIREVPAGFAVPCVPLIELDGSLIPSSQYDAVADAQNCNFVRIFNDYNQSATLQGASFAGLSSDTIHVTWHVVSKSGHDSTCVSKVHLKPVEYVIPSAFSPNGDGKNDTWFVPGLDVSSDDYSLKVFDRWGNLVYDHSKSHAPWDGKDMKGTELPVDSYHYFLIFKDSKKKPVIGVVTILK